MHKNLFIFHSNMKTADQKERLEELEKIKNNKTLLEKFEKTTTGKQRIKYNELRAELGLEPDPEINNNLSYKDIGKKINKLLKSNK